MSILQSLSPLNTTGQEGADLGVKWVGYYRVELIIPSTKSALIRVLKGGKVE
jgi:hypothetical protein